MNQSNFIDISPFIEASVVQSDLQLVDWQADNKTEQHQKKN